MDKTEEARGLWDLRLESASPASQACGKLCLTFFETTNPHLESGGLKYDPPQRPLGRIECHCSGRALDAQLLLVLLVV